MLGLVCSFHRHHKHLPFLQGILLKGGHVLDALAACQNIAFDKTGTLTTGEFMCKAIEPIHGHLENNEKQAASCCVYSCEKEALAVAAAMEKGTTHPIGRLLNLVDISCFICWLIVIYYIISCTYT